MAQPPSSFPCSFSYFQISCSSCFMVKFGSHLYSYHISVPCLFFFSPFFAFVFLLSIKFSIFLQFSWVFNHNHLWFSLGFDGFFHLKMDGLFLSPSVFPPSLPRPSRFGRSGAQACAKREAAATAGMLELHLDAIGASILGAEACFHGENMGNLVVILIVVYRL